MTDTAADAARTDRPRRAPKVGGQGQWALGETEPLNANERFKQEDDALNVRARIEDVYSKQGFASISGDDLHGRFRWWGLYTQRKPGIDGGKTASLEPHELEDEYFMLRVRVDGGALTTEQTAGHRRGVPRLRPGHRRHHRPAEHPAALGPGRGRARDLGAAGGRRPADHRGLRRLPPRHPRVAGRRHLPGRAGRPDAGDRGDPASLHRRPGVLATCRASSSPRSPGCSPTTSCTRSTTSRSSGSSTPSSAPATTCGSAAGSRPTRGWPSGSARSWPRTRCPTCGPAWSSVFRDYGYRRMRHKARLKFLLADWGPEKFREVLETEYLEQPLPDGPAPGPDRGPRRPHRRPRAEGRPLLRRRRARRGPRLRRAADPARRHSPRRTARRGSG